MLLHKYFHNFRKRYLPVGLCPKAFIAVPSSVNDKKPSWSLSNSMNTSLYSANCSSSNLCTDWKRKIDYFKTLKKFTRSIKTNRSTRSGPPILLGFLFTHLTTLRPGGSLPPVWKNINDYNVFNSIGVKTETRKIEDIFITLSYN